VSEPAEGRRLAYRRGRRGETLAAWWLRLKGYRILARGLKSPVGEIDIVACRGRTLAIVEVKRRDDRAAAVAAIGPRQPARIARAASWLLVRRPEFAGHAVRFDVLLIAPRRWPRHLVDAWRSEGGR
jgi:putative endonuclease